jgi:hypothetical protein
MVSVRSHEDATARTLPSFRSRACAIGPVAAAATLTTMKVTLECLPIAISLAASTFGASAADVTRVAVASKQSTEIAADANTPVP